jgi:anti-anti-sigma regulatory factor
MLRIDINLETDGDARLTLAGKCNGTSLGELRRAIERARRTRKRVLIDLSEVTLLDKPSLQFLAAQPWIHRELPQ